MTLLNPPPSSPLHHAEPFGPVDTIVLVDTEAELLAAMNASNGALVATLATDEQATYDRLAPQIRALKTGHGVPLLPRRPSRTVRRLRRLLARRLRRRRPSGTRRDPGTGRGATPR